MNPRGVLGVRTADGAIVPLLDFRQPAPFRALFTTTADGQRRAVFDFYYREAGAVAWTYLDSLCLPRIPPARAGEPDLKLEARLQPRGDLLLKVQDPLSNQPADFVLQREMLERLLAAQSGAAPARAAPARAATPASGANPPAADSVARSRARPAARPAGGAKRLRPLLAALALCAALAGGYALLRHYDMLPAARPPAPRAAGAERQAPEPLTARPEQPRPAAAPPPAPAEAAGPAPMDQLAVQPAVQAPAPKPVPATAPTAASPAPSRAEAPTARHPIAWGDTLWRIAERYYGERGLYRELAESNALVDPDRIIAGRTLLLPPALADRERKPQGE